jgi:hypothetical protein
MQVAEQVKRKVIGFGKRSRARMFQLNRAAICGALCLICVLPIPLNGAQDLPPPPLPVDPTPLSDLLSQTEKLQLNEARGGKKEIDFYVKVGDSHLEAALSSIKNQDYRSSERELDIYRKAMSEAMKATASQQESRRSLSKKIEQNLYKQIKTLEAVELLFPIERQAFATAALKHAKQLRVQALNAAFASGDTLKDPDEQKKPKADSPNKDGSSQIEKPLAHTLALAFVVHEVVRGSVSGRQGRYDTGAHNPRSVTYTPVVGRSSSTQSPNDYLTEEEGDKVREAQSADARAKVFMKIADRRIQLITGKAPPPIEKQSGKKGEKKAEEEERDWGVLKTTSRAELLKHYSRAIEECMAKIEDAHERNPKGSAVGKALATLREATDRHLQVLKSLTSQLTDENEVRALRDAIEAAELANKGARDGVKAK